MSHGRSWLQERTYDLSRIAVRVVGWLLFRFRFDGGDRFPSCGGAIVCANHQSFLDPPLVGATCDRRMNYLARENLFDTRFFGGLIRWYDAIPVKHDGLGIGGLRETLKRLKRGELVLLFPEGTRTNNGEVGEIKSGFCVLARRANVPIVPVGMDGAYDVWPRDKKLPGWGRICIKVGEPISVDLVARLSDAELVALLDERLRDCHQASRQRRLGKPELTESP